jgi:hypothetical protein
VECPEVGQSVFRSFFYKFDTFIARIALIDEQQVATQVVERVARPANVQIQPSILINIDRGRAGTPAFLAAIPGFLAWRP